LVYIFLSYLLLVRFTAGTPAGDAAFAGLTESERVALGARGARADDAPSRKGPKVAPLSEALDEDILMAHRAITASRMKVLLLYLISCSPWG